MLNNKKQQSLNKYKGKNKDKSVEYIFFSFIDLFFHFQKKFNRLINLSKRIKSLNHLIYILKIS